MKPGAAGGGGKAGSVGGAGHRGGDEENGDTDKQAPHMQVSPPSPLLVWKKVSIFIIYLNIAH